MASHPHLTVVLARSADGLPAAAQRHLATLSLDHVKALSIHNELDFGLFCDLYDQYRSEATDVFCMQYRTEAEVAWIIANERRVTPIVQLFTANRVPDSCADEVLRRWSSNATIMDAIVRYEHGGPQALLEHLWARMSDDHRSTWVRCSEPADVPDADVVAYLTGDDFDDETRIGGLRELHEKRPQLTWVSFESRSYYAVLAALNRHEALDDWDRQVTVAKRWANGNRLAHKRVVRAMVVNPRTCPAALDVIAATLTAGNADAAEFIELLEERATAQPVPLTGPLDDVTDRRMLERLVTFAELVGEDGTNNVGIIFDLVDHGPLYEHPDLVTRVGALLHRWETQQVVGIDRYKGLLDKLGYVSDGTPVADRGLPTFGPADTALARYIGDGLPNPDAWTLVLALADTFEGTAGELVETVRRLST